MSVQQLYYTSCARGISGSGGFQIKALTPGLSREVQELLLQNLAYRIPTTLDPQTIRQHPPALRYRLHGDTGLLLCSQSNGADEFGRAGNFFAHCLIMPSERMDYAPIQYWRHPNWKTTDASAELEIPALPAFVWEPSLAFEAIWAFLDAEGRREQFQYLLSALLCAEERRRPLVILDTPDHIALWIAAATFALPFSYRRFLSFASYHHDPYQAPFLLIGTTRDSRFRASNEDYQTYFVLNAFDNRLSSAPPSAYADWVCQHFSADGYEAQLIDFFFYCQGFTPNPPDKLSGPFDTMAYAYRCLREHSLPLADVQARASVRLLLETAANNGGGLNEQTAEDLQIASGLCREGLQQDTDAELLTLYCDTLLLLRKHGAVLDAYCQHDMQFAAHLITQERQREADRLFNTLKQVYRIDNQIHAARALLDAIAKAMPPKSWAAYEQFWHRLGPLIDSHDSPTIAILLRNSFDLLDTVQSDGLAEPEPVAGDLIKAIQFAFAAVHYAPVLALLAKRQGKAKPAFAWLYYGLISNLDLPQRAEFRQTHFPAIPSQKLIAIELNREFAKISVDTRMNRLAQWLAHAKTLSPDMPRLVVNTVFKILWDRVSTHDKKTLAAEFLSPLYHAYLPNETLAELLSAYFFDLHLSVLQGKTLELAERFLDHPALPEKLCGLLEGAWAMTKGELREKRLSELRERLIGLNKSEYEKAAEKLLGKFFERKIKPTDTQKMLRTIYHDEYQDIFWAIYWQHFETLLTEPQDAERVEAMLAFWFNDSKVKLQGFEYGYARERFFIELPQVLGRLADSKGFKKVVEHLDKKQQELAWYPAFLASLGSSKAGVASQAIGWIRRKL